jgi:hypothetical protein
MLTYTIEYLHIYHNTCRGNIIAFIAANWVFVFPNGKLMEKVKLAEYGCRVFRDKYYPKYKEKFNKVLYFTSNPRDDSFWLIFYF